MKKKKDITKEQIINTALDLMKDKNELRTVNMREIARTLGCAHTNIYNYFASYTDLLWETHTALMYLLQNTLSEEMGKARTPETKLRYYFQTLIGVYINNKGWFRLAWTEYIGNERPQKNIDAIQKTHLALNHYIDEIWREMTEIEPDITDVDRVVHNTHCYIIGEISNYISGRGLVESEAELKEFIEKEAIEMMTLYIMRG